MGYAFPQPEKVHVTKVPCPVCLKTVICGGFVESGEHVISCSVCGFRNEVAANIVVAVESLINYQAWRAESAAMYGRN